MALVRSANRAILKPIFYKQSLKRFVSRMCTVSRPEQLLQPANIPERLLMGPGPSNMTPQIAHSQSEGLLGHLHPEFVKIMDDVREGIKYAFQTSNTLTFAVSGTGHAGMECALLNLLERGEKLLVVENGIWGTRAADLGNRLGLNVQKVSVQPGQAISLDAFKQAVEEFHPSVVFVCHGESSSGVCQPLDGMGVACHEKGALLLVDTVASLGGAPFNADKLQVDCVYSATQKVLNAPPGLAPISFSSKAVDKMKSRGSRVASFYFDALELGNYWGCFNEPRRYHHTAPISTVYALRSALSSLVKEGIDECVERHLNNAQLLYSLLEQAKLKPFVENVEWRLPCLTTVTVPQGVKWNVITTNMMLKGIEVAGGLGPTVGKVWRIGTFGANSTEYNIRKVVTELQNSLADAGLH